MVPDGYTTVTPWIIGHDTAGLLDFLKRAFDAEELGRVVGEDGKIGHAEVRIGDAVVMAFDSPGEWAATRRSCGFTCRTAKKPSAARSKRVRSR